MPAKLIDGNAIGATMRAELGGEITALKKQGIRPGLAVVLVGDNPASEVYVRMKGKACWEAGIYGVSIKLPKDTSEADLMKEIERLNAASTIHGILVQLPLPKQIDANRVLHAIDPHKDVDGFHPENVGKVAASDPTGFRPATPYGVQQLLLRSGVETKGAHAVIVGRLIVAIGKPEFVTGSMVKPGAVVIDVGVNRVDDPSRKQGYRLVGDVQFEEAKQVASAITPVPGGVGPMTITMLLYNTVQAARQWANR